MTVVQAAVGAAPGRAEMAVSNQASVSSLQPDWVRTMRANNRFGPQTRWDRRITVPVTTLDDLVRAHGRPAFVKVDVEGYELEAAGGLTRPVPAASYEFMPEYVDRAVAVLDHLASLGPVEANLALGDDLRFPDARWVDVATLRDRLTTLAGDPAA